MRLPVWTVGVGLLGMWCGCGPGAEPRLPPLVPVSGTVTWEGEPLIGATVRFMPTDGTPGSGGYGVTGARGTYQLTASIRQQPGVPQGEYRVLVMTPLMMEDYQPQPEAPPFTKVVLPRRYSVLEETVLSARVSAGGSAVDLALKSSP